MYGLLICAMFVAPHSDSDTASPASLDGTWTVLSMEKDGQPVADAKKATVTINNNTVTCNKSDAKHEMKTMRLEFGPQATIRVTESSDGRTNEKVKTGVYVLSKDFLAICLHDEAGATATAKTEGERTSLKVDGPFTAKPQTKPHCTMVLQRTSR